MLKKQHILLGLLFLGMSVKPMEKSDSNNMALALGVSGVVSTGIGLIWYRSYSSYKTQKRLCEDKWPYGSEINIYNGIDESGVDEEAENYNETRIHKKEKSNLPYFGISYTNVKKYTAEVLRNEVLRNIDKFVKLEHIPSFWDTFKGRSGYNQLNDEKIKGVIEKYNESRYKLMGSKKFNQDLICGWLEVHKGAKTLYLARCLNNKSKEESGLSQKYRFFEAWLGNTQDNSYEQLFESEEDSVQILSKEIKDKNSFIVSAAFSHLPGEYDNITTKSGSSKLKYKDLDGQKIVENVREMINDHIIHEIIPDPSLAFNRINIEEGTMSAITVVTFNNTVGTAKYLD